VAQRVGRGIALLFHDRGTRRGGVVSSTCVEGRKEGRKRERNEGKRKKERKKGSRKEKERKKKREKRERKRERKVTTCKGKGKVIPLQARCGQEGG